MQICVVCQPVVATWCLDAADVGPVLQHERRGARLKTLRLRRFNSHSALKDVLTCLPAMTNRDDLAPLLPGNWKPTAATS